MIMKGLAKMLALDGWRAAAQLRYCAHGAPLPACDGDRLSAPCLESEYVFCAHGADSRKLTRNCEACCPWCRGITRRYRNPDTWRRSR